MPYPSITTTDFLIVGGGTAGCVLANRLSALGAEVRLLEAGIDTPPNATPDDIADIYPRSYYNSAYMWRGLTADQGADGTDAKTPGVTNQVVTRVLEAVLDSAGPIRHLALKYGIAAGDVNEERMRSRGWLEGTIRRHAFGTYHPAGTCRMGSPSDPGSVVDADCAVHGVDGLSVVDASIMPTVTRGNTNIPVTMIAERAAERITQNTSEAKHPTSVFQSPDDQ